mmetsp:Transcript_3834/g.10772  ORF Transcript_3834/g.10772 Transcript_3834/m.10772 type:complete len:211 (-) Transcript_3834:1091-1723(-)
MFDAQHFFRNMLCAPLLQSRLRDERLMAQQAVPECLENQPAINQIEVVDVRHEVLILGNCLVHLVVIIDVVRIMRMPEDWKASKDDAIHMEALQLEITFTLDEELEGPTRSGELQVDWFSRECDRLRRRVGTIDRCLWWRRLNESVPRRVLPQAKSELVHAWKRLFQRSSQILQAITNLFGCRRFILFTVVIIFFVAFVVVEIFFDGLTS